MHTKQQLQNSLSRASSRVAMLALAIVFVLALILIFPQPAQAQTFKVIYNFTGGQDGQQSDSGLTMDQAGNLYGTTRWGGQNGLGNVFKLSHRGSDWVLTTLYSFQGGDDGAVPDFGDMVDREGSLFGTTVYGGGGDCSYGCGTIFKLRPAATACGSILCPWTETVLYRFSGSDGEQPEGDLVFDQAGNLYGTTNSGGASGSGTVFMLSPSGGGWTFIVLHSFTGLSDGGWPWSGVIIDGAGDLYGTTMGPGGGTVFRLTYSGSRWTESVLHTFQYSDGIAPFGNVVFDQAGNLYGTTASGGSGGGGTVFMLSPSGGSWIFSVLYSFTGGPMGGSHARLAMDSAGNLYGTTSGDGVHGEGSVFKLTPSNGSWIYTDLYDFTGGDDGGTPEGGVTLDQNGNLYGTTAYGGAYSAGVVWEITP